MRTMSACCLSVSLKLSEEFEVMGGTRRSRSDYERGSTLGEDQRGSIAVGKVWNTGHSCHAERRSRSAPTTSRLLFQSSNQKMATKTNAARASHPSRIVFADILAAVFRPGAKEHRAIALVRAQGHRCSPEACATGLRFSASILLKTPKLGSLKAQKKTIKEAVKPGHRRTGHAPIFPR